MLAYERRNEIKEILREDKTVNVEELARRFFVSESTIRRDLDMISNEGMIRRTYGGAVMLDNMAGELPITLREHENTGAKHEIAKKAVSMIRDGMTIILDTSSTVTAMVPLLGKFETLTVITNGIKTSYLLNSYGRITTFCTGGRLREHNMSLVGMTTCRRIAELNADIAFISCRGLSADRGVTEASEEEAEVKKAMISAAAETVLLCDSSKLGIFQLNRVCHIDSLSTIITEDKSIVPDNIRDRAESCSVKII